MDRHIPIYCRNLFQDFCDPRVRERYAARSTNPGELYNIGPAGMKLEEYEKICLECRFRELEINEPRCVICQNNHLEFIKFNGANYVYNCIACGETLYARRDILREEDKN